MNPEPTKPLPDKETGSSPNSRPTGDPGNLGELYDAEYYATSCGAPYEHNEAWMAFFGQVADHIVADLQPRTVLDAGSAMGFLVEVLRLRGVEAWGIDISEYAIRNVQPEFQPYCQVGSILDPFPQPHYDLIVCIEVLEHLPAEQAEAAVANLCRYADDILFTSTPFDDREKTHFNIQPPEYWANLFLRQGFIHDVDHDASYLTEWAMLFRKSSLSLEQYTMLLEHRFWLQKQENRIRRALGIETKNELVQIQNQRWMLKMKLADRDAQHASLAGQLAEKDAQRAWLEERLAEKETQRTRLEERLDEEKDKRSRVEERLAEKEAQRNRLEEWLEEISAQRTQLVNSLAEKEAQRSYQNAQLAEVNAQLSAVLNSRSWRFMWYIQRLRERIIPVGSKREVAMNRLFRGLRILKDEGPKSFLQRVRHKLDWQAKVARSELHYRVQPPREARLIEVEDIHINPPAPDHQASVDLIICVHNAPEDVKRCLEAVIRHTSQPYSLILVDDGSEAETRDLLAEFARLHNCRLLRNEQAKGYTLAANQGLHSSQADFALLLNSDTVVTPRWVDQMVACAESNLKNGLVGPLSNCATWQSIPEIITGGEWAENPLPEHVSVQLMGEWVAARSTRSYPEMQFLNGFCLLIRRAVIEQIGYFDEENFGVGYGEENDYCLRAKKQGWRLALADDTYIYHAHSRSYSSERRRKLSERANRSLAKKHGQQIINQGTADCRENRVLQGIRAHSKHIIPQEEIIQKARVRFKDKRVVFVLPIWAAGGGANVVALAAEAMRRMGVDAHILNLPVHRASFESAYPHLGVPMVYGEIEEIPRIVQHYDAAVGTFNPTISWIAPALEKRPKLIVGYYIQDYEPYFYTPNTPGHKIAKDSYTLIPNLVRCVTTQWIYDQIQLYHRLGAEQDLPCMIIGASFDTSLFWPRPRHDPHWPERPIRIAAMVRPHSERRSPHMTMEILQQISREFGDKVEFKLFGTKINDPGFEPLPKDFPWDLAGELRQLQIADVINEADIFVDFSVFQGLGLTAMESLSSGCAAVIPQVGGGSTFAVDGENCLVVDTHNPQACYDGLKRLIVDHDLRQKLQRNGISAALQFYPELPTYRLLEALFPE